MSACTGTFTSTKADANRTPNEDVFEVVATFACVSADTTATISIPYNGILIPVIYKTPDTSNDNLTSTLTISDNAGNEVFSSESGIAENTTSSYEMFKPLSGTITVLITFNEAVGVSATFTVYLRGI